MQRHRENTGCRDRYEHRQRAIRAVVASQWAVACQWWRVFDHYDCTSRLLADSIHRFGLAVQASAVGWLGREIAELPTPEQIVDGGGA